MATRGRTCSRIVAAVAVLVVLVVLAACGSDGDGGGGGGATSTTARAATSTTAVAAPTSTRPANVQAGVTAGAFCSPEGAPGETSTGRAMVCTKAAGDDRARWRAA